MYVYDFATSVEFNNVSLINHFPIVVDPSLNIFQNITLILGFFIPYLQILNSYNMQIFQQAFTAILTEEFNFVKS